MHKLEPIFLTPHYDERPWGGSLLKSLFEKRPPYTRTGESWEVSARLEGQSTVKNGAFAGYPLQALYEAQPELFGCDAAAFPFLIKYIDANETLSVQVHPNDITASLFGGEPKSEAWVVLWAAPGARLAIGGDFDDGAHLKVCLMDGSFQSRLHWHEAKAGDTFFIPGGTLHAIGSGLLIYEVQQPSNTTYRVYDWGRGREVHIEQSAQCYQKDAAFTKVSPPAGAGHTLLTQCPYFKLERFDASAKPVTLRTGKQFAAVSAMGPGTVLWDNDRTQYAAGDSFLLPAGDAAYTFTEGTLYVSRP